MKFAEVLYNLLGTNTDVAAALTDPSDGLKIFPVVIPQKTIYPAVAFGEKSCDLLRCKPTVLGSIKQTTHIVQVNTFAETYQEVIDINNLLVAALDGFTGAINDIRAVSIFFKDQKEGFDTDLNLYVKITEYQIKIKIQ